MLTNDTDIQPDLPLNLDTTTSLVPVKEDSQSMTAFSPKNLFECALISAKFNPFYNIKESPDDVNGTSNTLINVGEENITFERKTKLYRYKASIRKDFIEQRGLKYFDPFTQFIILTRLASRRQFVDTLKVPWDIKTLTEKVTYNPRQEDYEKIRFNLEVLAVRQWKVLRKMNNKFLPSIFSHINLHWETEDTFVYEISGIPTIVGQSIQQLKRNPEIVYVPYTKKELNDRLPRYTGLCNAWCLQERPKDSYIKTPMLGETILRKVLGYLDDIDAGIIKKYENRVARRLMKLFIETSATFNFTVNEDATNATTKDERKKRYYVTYHRTKADTLDNITEEELTLLSKILAIYRGNDPRYNDPVISKNWGLKLIREWGKTAVESAIDKVIQNNEQNDGNAIYKHLPKHKKMYGVP